MAQLGAANKTTVPGAPYVAFSRLKFTPRRSSRQGSRRDALGTRCQHFHVAIAPPVPHPGPGARHGLRVNYTQEAEGAQALQCVDRRHTLPDGCVLELLEIKPPMSAAQSAQPPLLFIHGANHAAWCWQENFLPWFALRGRHVMAVSFRGHGQSCNKEAGKDMYQQSVKDLDHVISSLPVPPVLVAHSMGGFFAQRYLVEQVCQKGTPSVTGVVMMASASLTACMPNAEWWRAQKNIMHAIKCIWWMMTSTALHNKSGDREMLFSPDLPDELLERYHAKLRDTQTSIPVKFNELRAFLPQVEAVQEAAKEIQFPIGVMIAGDDSLIMRHQVQATADYFGVQPVALPGLAHDMMLDTRWPIAAQALEDWLQTQFPCASQTCDATQVGE